MLECTQAPKGIWPLAYNEENHQLKILNLVDNWPIFTIETSHPKDFFYRKFCLDCMVIAKTFLGLAEGTKALIIMAGCSYWLRKAKNKQGPLLKWPDKTG